MATPTNKTPVNAAGHRIRREHQRTRNGKTVTVREHTLAPITSRRTYPAVVACRLTAEQRAWLQVQAATALNTADQGMAAQVRRLIAQAMGRDMTRAVTITETFTVTPGDLVTVEPGKTVLIETGTADGGKAAE